MKLRPLAKPEDDKNFLCLIISNKFELSSNAMGGFKSLDIKTTAHQ